MKAFNFAEDVVSTEVVVTDGFADGGVGLLQGQHITTSSLSAVQKKYYYNLQYNSKDHISVSYGHIAGSGSSEQSSTVEGETKAVYGQFYNLVESDRAALKRNVGFIIGNVTCSDAYFLSVERLQMKDRLNPGTWTVTLSGSISDGSSDSIHLTDDSKTSWATQVGITKPQWSASILVNQKYNGWGDDYYHSLQHGPSSSTGNFSSLGLRGWWRPLETGSATPSISLGYDSTTYDGAPAASDSSDAWFAGLMWQDTFQADDKIGVAFGQPTTNEDEATDPFAYELYYSYMLNDSVSVTPAVFGGTDRNGTAGGDVFGALVQTTFKF